MTFTEKISSIENLLGKSKRFKDKNLLACAIYFKLRLAVPYRKIPLEQVFTWFNLRYWLQKLEKKGTLNQIKSIVGGEET